MPARAKRVICLHMLGAISHVDTFDYKPTLERMHGQDLPPSVRETQRLSTMSGGQSAFPIVGPLRPFKQRGESGAWVSDFLPYTGAIADELCFVKSLHTEHVNHDPASKFLHTGFQLAGRPSAGAWVSYALGSDNRDLPNFVVMNSGVSQGVPQDAAIWGPGFLPSHHQGVEFRAADDPVLYVNNPAGIDSSDRRAMLDSLAKLATLQHAESNDPEILSRVSQYEMAYRMQSSVPEVADISDEPEAVLEMYGPDVQKPGTFARNCLIARRLAERGVKYQTLFHLGWDLHLAIKQNFPLRCGEIDRPAAALVMDLKQRGLLDDTLVMFGSEFGRTPFAQGPDRQPARRPRSSRRLFHLVVRRRRRQSRLHARRDRRVQLQHRQRPRAHPRLERDVAAHSGARSRAPDVPLPGPRLPTDRRPWQGRARDPGVTTVTVDARVRFFPRADFTSSRCTCRSASSSPPSCSIGSRAGRATRRSRSAAPLLWGAAAISAVLTAVLGYLHFAEGGFTGPSAEAHGLWGTVTAVAARRRLVARARAGRARGRRAARGRYRDARARVDHGPLRRQPHARHDVLCSEYAPSFLRSLIGAAPRRPPVTSVAAADPYLDVVQPLLEQRCGTCHNDDKREGGFSVGSYDSTLVGGDTGRAIVPGNLEASELIYRTGLPPDDEAFMPAEGKTPLTAEQVEILRWWVGAGAPHDTTVGAIGAPGDIEPLLAARARARRRCGDGRVRCWQRNGRSRNSSPTCSRRACWCDRYRRATLVSSSA